VVSVVDLMRSVLTVNGEEEFSVCVIPNHQDFKRYAKVAVI